MHTVSVDPVQAVDVYFPAPQIVQSMHFASLLGVHGTQYWLPVHVGTEQAAHLPPLL